MGAESYTESRPKRDAATLRWSRDILTPRRVTQSRLGLGQQQHLVSQLLELDDQAASF
jgi:hypothetical protein